ncbi:DUF1127 domain-containing protein [Agarivorans sp. TSD2052]|uniref:DUF1127 domain-containing protein n=1 Tax=Agarivorans sp. TSD2052 TaxID=2937286 RepID=UPI00200F867C|nr:DUF1127 domain-containing protein [Agarivorans sp. TSD2052]UPW17341.1 DUF1127 domain-containing protein [Agarivorans sp. TSD2052]
MRTLNHYNTKLTSVHLSLIRLNLSRYIKSLNAMLLRRKTRKHLASLPDYLLKDIGINRNDALHEASKPFWKV